MIDLLPNALPKTKAHIPTGSLPDYNNDPAVLTVINTHKPFATHFASFMHTTPERGAILTPALLDIAIPLGPRGAAHPEETYTQILILPRTFADLFRQVPYLRDTDDANRMLAFWTWGNDKTGYTATQRLDLTVGETRELLNPQSETTVTSGPVTAGPSLTPDRLDALTIHITLDLLNESHNRSPQPNALERVAGTIARMIRAAQAVQLEQ